MPGKSHGQRAWWAIVHGVERVGQDLATKPPNLIKQNLVCTRTQEKGAVNPQETDLDMTMSVQKSPAEAWVGGGLFQGQSLSTVMCAWDILKKVPIIFITSIIVSLS